MYAYSQTGLTDLPRRYILLHGPDCRLIASTEENSDDSLLDWTLNGMQFVVCKSFAGIYVLRTRFAIHELTTSIWLLYTVACSIQS